MRSHCLYNINILRAYGQNLTRGSLFLTRNSLGQEVCIKIPVFYYELTKMIEEACKLTINIYCKVNIYFFSTFLC